MKSLAKLKLNHFINGAPLQQRYRLGNIITNGMTMLLVPVQASAVWDVIENREDSAVIEAAKLKFKLFVRNSHYKEALKTYRFVS